MDCCVSFGVSLGVLLGGLLCVSFGVSLGVLLGVLLGVSFIRCVVSRLVFL